MRFIKRYIKKELGKKLNSDKVIVLYGPRQVGKTTLVKEIIKNLKGKILLVRGEDLDAQKIFSSQSIAELKLFIGDNKYLIIDEAQQIPNIGLNLKLIIDHIPNVKVLATGSSSFELSNQVGEPLVGRKWQFTLYPIAQMELTSEEDYLATKKNLQQRLIYGGYPEIITSQSLEEKRELLESILDNYLFKDILTLENLKRPNKLLDLLKLIAFQIGKEVSLRELANSLEINVKTVERYLALFEKVFVLKRVYGFSRNLRKEITKNSRFYFYDLGIRNAIIKNFNDLDTRNDIGELWENYLFIERLKRNSYLKNYSNSYFWRTYEQKEIDLVEERAGKLYGYEFKWKTKKVKVPKDWVDNYKNAKYEVISQDNYLEFIT